jgi:hypothetical protein
MLTVVVIVLQILVTRNIHFDYDVCCGVFVAVIDCDLILILSVCMYTK